jgi:hypothetical protein
VGWLSDLTGSNAASLYAFGATMILGGVLVLLLPHSVNDRAVPVAATPVPEETVPEETR